MDNNKGIISGETPEQRLASRQNNNNNNGDAPLIFVNEMAPRSRDPIMDTPPGPNPNLLGPPSYQSTLTVVGDGETEAQRKEREERENMERNEMSLVRMLVRHNQNIGITGNMNVFKSSSGQDLDPTNKKGSGGMITPVGSFSNLSITGSISSVDEFSYTSSTNNLLRDDLRRTASMVSWGPGPCQKEIMSRRYKLVTSGVLWFCYYSLALNDYIFGPTFNDLSMILQVSFDKIAYFAVYRQLAYTLGSLGGLAFDYLNRQLLLIVLLLLSAASLLATPFVPNMTCFFLIAIINGFSAGACDVGFHVWILEMFQNGGGPLLQALHFSFGLGIATAPLISANFLSAEDGACSAPDVNSDTDGGHTHGPNLTTVNQPDPMWTREDIATRRHELFIPYCITGVVVGLGGLILLGLYYYKKYIPPQERKLPVSFDEQMPQQLTSGEKILVWKRSLPSKYIITIICLGALMLWAYYGLEVTYFQFLAQFANAVPLPIHGAMSANLEAATGAAYAMGGAIATWLSFRCYPENMIYLNFMLINIGSIILILFSQTSLVWFWIGNIVIGLGFSSCYATAYTFLEHHINVTNMIGSLFLFAGGAGTALFPILLADICSNPNLVIHLCLACANFALLLFMLMHFITIKRQRHVKLIQDRLLKNPAILLQIKQRTLSQLSYAPQ